MSSTKARYAFRLASKLNILLPRVTNSNLQLPATVKRSFHGHSISKAPNKGLKPPEHLEDLVQTDHLIIGGGVVGLAAGYKLTQAKKKLGLNNDTIVLIERNHRVGDETSARNSEVIHAGIYYPSGSLKEKLCIDGRKQLYEYCKAKGINHSNIGKWIVAQTETSQVEYLHKLKNKADVLGVPAEFISVQEANRQEPNVKASVVLESTSTGIIDSASFLKSLEWEFSSLSNHHLVVNSSAINVIKSPFGQGYLVQIEPTMQEAGNDSAYWIQTRTIINAAGLGADHLANMINLVNGLPATSPSFKYHFCKGDYFSYSGLAPARRLVYPVPDANLTSLGLHLTLDLSGSAKFGPDVEFLDNVTYPNFDYSVQSSRRSRFFEAASSYLHNIDAERLNPDYSGIRPKLSRDKASDFVLQASGGQAINLVGIESPGLTSSLAIGDWVVSQLY
ncbi:hypothetical protein DSO57_1000776 [Entomophthora muscae]|uniref:Uncharacterized protein n=1 Tax=Entomophthora muscae TaxID=34485 RepID=A0ACC2T963_9FUNG|nr:hypothetical protein DSO57_1000776 [Entomophthora muscae]